MIYYEKHPSYSLSQGRQSKPQPDLDTGVCLRTSEFRAFTRLSHLLTSNPVLLSQGLHFRVHSRDITANPGRLGKKLCQFVLCHFSELPVRYYQPRSLSISQHLSQCFPWSARVFPTSKNFPPARFSTFSPGLLLWKHQSKKFMCRSTACDQSPEWWFSHVSLLTWGFRMCISLVQLLMKFTASPEQLQQVSGMCLLESSKVHFQTFTPPPHIHIIICRQLLLTA